MAAPDIYFNFPLKNLYREYIVPYALRIAPVILIWAKLTYDLLTCKFSPAVAVTKIPITHGK